MICRPVSSKRAIFPVLREDGRRHFVARGQFVPVVVHGQHQRLLQRRPLLGPRDVVARRDEEASLAESFVLGDLHAARRSQAFLVRDRLYGHDPRVTCELLEELLRLGLDGKGRVAARPARKTRRKGVLNWPGLRDLWAARKL